MKRILFFFLMFFCVAPAYPHAEKKKKPSAAPAQSKASPSQVNLFKERPADIRIPGEWEEVQAILLSWPYAEYDPRVDRTTARQMQELFAFTWVQLAAAIQEECSVWIRIHSGQDSTMIKNIMTHYGVPLTRYKFLVYPINQMNNFWVRDYGPVGFYYGEADSLGFIDTRYSFEGNDPDDEFPGIVAKQTGARVFRTPLLYENGNFDTDGQGRGFFTTRVKKANIEKNRWTVNATMDSIRKVFNLSEMVPLKELMCDGGTGHIDMFFKMLDEENIALVQYPSALPGQDRNTIEENYAKLKTLSSVYNRPYTIHRIPMPSSDDGNYRNTSCEQMSLDPRSYINGLFVNKTFILPVFSDNRSGNIAQDESVMELFSKNTPGLQDRRHRFPYPEQYRRGHSLRYHAGPRREPDPLPPP